MKNFVPLGTGNSRLMKSSITAGTTWEQARAMLIAGTFPYDTGQLNAAGISQQGDPLNKNTLLKDATAQSYGLGTDAVPDTVLEKLASAPIVQKVGVPISNLEPGSVFQIDENGSPVDFIVAQHDYQSGNNGTGRTLVVRKEVHSQLPWNSTDNASDYSTSSIDTWLNETYLSMLDADTQSAIGKTKFPINYISNGSWTLKVISRSVFLLSGKELGNSGSAGYSDQGDDGTKIDIASSLLSVSNQMTRSPRITGGTKNCWYASGTKFSYGTASTSRGVRPVFTLPPTFIATYQYNLVDMIGNLIAIPSSQISGLDFAKIATGSYTGTGAYGSRNPNSLTFDFEPKVVCITAEQKTSALFLVAGDTKYRIPYLDGNDSSLYSGVVSFSGKTVTWYTTNTVTAYENNAYRTQKNVSGTTYFYFALG